MTVIGNFARLLGAASLCLAALTLPQAAGARPYKVLEYFKKPAGIYPSGSLLADPQGNLYGVTLQGGITNCRNGCGVVYRIAADGSFSVFYAFQGGNDGLFPSGNLLRDSNGNLYGTTYEGGAPNGGTVYELTPGGTKTILHTFGANDGEVPAAGLIADTAGNLYGTTAFGGANGSDEGAVFKIAPDGHRNGALLLLFAGELH